MSATAVQTGSERFEYNISSNASSTGSLSLLIHESSLFVNSNTEIRRNENLAPVQSSYDEEVECNEENEDKTTGPIPISVVNHPVSIGPPQSYYEQVKKEFKMSTSRLKDNFENTNKSGLNGDVVIFSLENDGKKLKGESVVAFDLPTVQHEKVQGIGKKAAIWPQILASISVSFGNMIIGLVSAYSSPALASMSSPNSTLHIEMDGPEASWMSSLMPLAALLGGILGGPLIERLGRKGTSLLTAIPAISAWILIAMASNMFMIYSGRIIAGLCVGIASLSLPVYLAEVVQPEVRGILGLLPTTVGNAGILICYVAGMFLDWQDLAYLCCGLSFPFLICIMFMPESPRWLLVQGKSTQAEASLQWLRGPGTDISTELEEIKTTYLESLKIENGGGKLTWRDLRKRAYAKPLYVALGLMALQQLCGINPVIFYTVYIFQTAGSTLDKHICAIIVGVSNFVSTFGANVVIDRVGRKLLLIVSDVLMTLSLLVLATFFLLKDKLLEEPKFLTEHFGWIPLCSFIVFVVAFSLGLGPVPWIMTAEIFPMRIRAGAVAATTAFHWFLTFAIVKVFPDFVNGYGLHSAFYLCAGVCVVGLYFIIRKVPETKGRSLEQIERKLLKSKKKGKKRSSKDSGFGPNGILF